MKTEGNEEASSTSPYRGPTFQTGLTTIGSLEAAKAANRQEIPSGMRLVPKSLLCAEARKLWS